MSYSDLNPLNINEDTSDKMEKYYYKESQLAEHGSLIKVNHLIWNYIIIPYRSYLIYNVQYTGCLVGGKTVRSDSTQKTEKKCRQTF